MVFALVCATTDKQESCNKDLFSFDQSRRALYRPIRKILITTNSVRVNNSSSSREPKSSLRHSSPFLTVYTSRCALLLFCHKKYAINIPTSTEALKSFEKSQNFQNYKFWKIFGPFFGPILNSGALAPTFRNSWALPQTLPAFRQPFLLPSSR